MRPSRTTFMNHFFPEMKSAFSDKMPSIVEAAS